MEALETIAQHKTAEQLPMAVDSSALGGKRVTGSRRSGVVAKLFAAEGSLVISALNDKSEPGPRQLPVVESISAFNDKSEPGLLQLPVVGGISPLNEKSEPELRQLPMVESISALNGKSEPGLLQLPVV
jgi:hypothetical protein